jgi:cytochrome c biogenesis protein CcdA
MFLQTLTEHQSHLLTRLVLIVVVISGFLFLFRVLNKKRKKPNYDKPQILNFEEQRKRKSKKRWGKGKREK